MKITQHPTTSNHPGRERSRYLIAVLSLAVASVCVAAPAIAQQPTAKQLIGDAVSDVGSQYTNVEEAITRFRNRDYDGARRYLELAKEKHANLPPVEVLLAKMHMASRNAARSRAALEQAVTNHPNDPEAYLMLGDQALASGRVTEAGALYHTVASIVESFNANAKRKRNFLLRTYAGNAIVAEQRRQYDVVIENLRKWIAADPESATAHQRLGHALFMSAKTPGEFNAAAVEYQTAKKLEPTLAHPDVALATLYHQKKDEANAKKSFESAMKADGQNISTVRNYAQWLLETGNTKAATKPLATARGIDANSVETLLLSGVAARLNGMDAEAEKYFLAAHALVPSNRDAINQLALLLINSENETQRGRALQYAHMNRQINQNHSEAAVTYGWVLYQSGRRREAGVELQNGVRLGSLNADSTYFLAKVQFDQDRLDTAEQLLKGALKSRGLFVNRQEAQQLLAAIGNKRRGG